MEYRLEGICHEPLGSYLAGLGLMAAVERHIDPTAKFYWVGLEFWIDTLIPKDQLVSQVVNRIEALPLFTPWNASCGIAIDKQAGNLSYTDAIEQIVESVSWRTDRIRDLIPKFWELIDEAKVESRAGWSYPKELQKQELILNCFDQVEDPLWQRWARTVIVPVNSYDRISIKHPKLLGTMGNIGAVDIAENYHTAFGILFDGNGDSTELASGCFGQAIFNDASDEKIQSTSVKGIHLFPAQDFNLDHARSKNYDYPPSSVGSSASINPAAILLATSGLCAFTGLCTALQPDEQPLETRQVAKYSLAVTTTGSSIDLVTLDERKNYCEEYFLPLWSEHHTYSSLVTSLFTSPLADNAQFYLSGQVFDGTDYIVALKDWAEANQVSGKFTRYALLNRKSRFDSFAVLLDILDINPNNLDRSRVDLAADLNEYRLNVRALARSKNHNMAQGVCYNFDRLFGKFATGKVTHSNLLLELGKVAQYLAPPLLRSIWLDTAAIESNCPEFRLAASIVSCGIDVKRTDFQSSDPISLLLSIQAQWATAANDGLEYYENSNRIFATLADIFAFIKYDNFSDSKFISWIWALKCVDFCTDKKKSLNFSDFPKMAYRLPVMYRVAATHLKFFYYKPSPVLRVAYSGDLTSDIAKLKGVGIYLSPAIGRSFEPNKRIAAALAFPISNWQKKTLIRTLQ